MRLKQKRTELKEQLDELLAFNEQIIVFLGKHQNLLDAPELIAGYSREVNAGRVADIERLQELLVVVEKAEGIICE